MTHKYIVYMGSGGLCHMLSGLSTAIKYAISHNRILVIDCLKLSSFKNKVLTYFDININNLIIQENLDELNKPVPYEKGHTLSSEQVEGVIHNLSSAAFNLILVMIINILILKQFRKIMMKNLD